MTKGQYSITKKTHVVGRRADHGRARECENNKSNEILFLILDDLEEGMSHSP